MLLLLLTCGAVTGLVSAAAIAVLVHRRFHRHRRHHQLRRRTDFVTLIVGAIEKSLPLGLALTSAGTSALAATGFISALLRAQKG